MTPPPDSNGIAGGVDYAEVARLIFEASRDRFIRVEQCYPAVDALRVAGFLAAPAEADARVEALEAALFDALHVLERLRDLTPARANEVTAGGYHGAVRAIVEAAADRIEPALAAQPSGDGA